MYNSENYGKPLLADGRQRKCFNMDEIKNIRFALGLARRELRILVDLLLPLRSLDWELSLTAN